MTRSHWLRSGALAGAALTGLIVWRSLGAPGDPPTFFLIEQFNRNFGQVLVHFDTEANRQYVLEYTTNMLALTGGTASQDWKVVYTVEAIPFQNHYVVLDGATNENRFYRLVATP